MRLKAAELDGDDGNEVAADSSSCLILVTLLANNPTRAREAVT